MFDAPAPQASISTTARTRNESRFTPQEYFPLKRHFEQHLHVRHRLSAIGAGRKMDFDDSPPEAVAGVVAEIL
jgi:hypothetical protein